MGSMKLGKFFRVNASRSGVSVSGGVKGLRLSVGSKGLRTHVTVPGTGYTKTKTLFSFKKLWKKKKAEKKKLDKKDEKLVVNEVIGDKEESTSTSQAIVQDELVLIMARRKPFGRFTDSAKADRMVNQAIEAYNQDRYDQALALLIDAHGLKGDDQEIILYLAVLLYLYKEDYNQALVYFDQLDEVYVNEDMLLAMADCLYETGDYETSMQLLESFKFDDDEEMERLTLLARNHLEKKNFVVAEEVFKSAVGRKSKLTPYLMDAKYWMGIMYLRLGDYDNAKKHLMPIYLEDSTYEDIALKVEELALSGSEVD